jgi:hypothetical protein
MRRRRGPGPDCFSTNAAERSPRGGHKSPPLPRPDWEPDGNGRPPPGARLWGASKSSFFCPFKSERANQPIVQAPDRAGSVAKTQSFAAQGTPRSPGTARPAARRFAESHSAIPNHPPAIGIGMWCRPRFALFPPAGHLEFEYGRKAPLFQTRPRRVAGGSKANPAPPGTGQVRPEHPSLWPRSRVCHRGIPLRDATLADELGKPFAADSTTCIAKQGDRVYVKCFREPDDRNQSHHPAPALDFSDVVLAQLGADGQIPLRDAPRLTRAAHRGTKLSLKSPCLVWHLAINRMLRGFVPGVCTTGVLFSLQHRALSFRSS